MSKVEMATCHICGAAYQVGAPHNQFCSGFKKSKMDKCSCCGNESNLQKCRSCGEIVCICCYEEQNCCRAVGIVE